MRLTSIDLDSDSDSEKRVLAEFVDSSGSFSSKTSSAPLNSEKNVSSLSLFVPPNTVTSTMIERIRGTQGTAKNEYMEVYADDDGSDTESARKPNIILDLDDDHERNLAFEVWIHYIKSYSSFFLPYSCYLLCYTMLGSSTFTNISGWFNVSWMAVRCCSSR